MDSLDFSFGDFKTSFEINKDIFDVNCYMYFYVGDATGYYKQDGTRVPYKKYLIEISLDSDEKTFTSNFKLDKDFFDLRLNATTKFYIKNNKYYIEFPDERFVKDKSIHLRYKKRSFTLQQNGIAWNSINPWNIVNFQEQLRSSEIEEFQNCIVNLFSSNLPANEPSLNIKWYTDMRCPFHYSAIKYYEKADCQFDSTCQGVSRGIVKSSYRLQKTINPDFDYSDSLGTFTRTYHGFLLEIRYANKFEVASYPNYIDKVILNPNRTKFINMVENYATVTKGCLPYATNCPIPPGRDPTCGSTFNIAGVGVSCNRSSGFGETDINDGALSCLTINCDFCYVNDGSYDCYCNCSGGSCCGGIRSCCCSPPGKEKTLSCVFSGRSVKNINHSYGVASSIKEICDSIDGCCCSSSTIYNDILHHLCVSNTTGLSSFLIGGIATQPIKKTCKNEFKINATTILNLKNKDINCYIDEPSKLLRSIFRLTDNQTTPPIEGCDFTGRNLIGNYRIKIFQGASNRFRITLFKTPEEFRNTPDNLNYHEVPFLSCYKSPILREYFKPDPAINNNIPMYVDRNTSNLKFAIIPDRLSTRFTIYNSSDLGLDNNSCQSFFDKCTYWAYVFNCSSLTDWGLQTGIRCNNFLNPNGIKLIKFYFTLVPIYNPGPPIDSYFIMTCRAKDVEFIGEDLGEDFGGVLSNPVIVRFPQDLYQDLTFNIAPNITWTINLLGTWGG